MPQKPLKFDQQILKIVPKNSHNNPQQNLSLLCISYGFSQIPKELLFDKFSPHYLSIKQGTLKIIQTIFLIIRSMNEDKRNE